MGRQKGNGARAETSGSTKGSVKSETGGGVKSETGGAAKHGGGGWDGKKKRSVTAETWGVL
jgi:hypothetical protein